MNELTFLDLVILKKIDANSSVENFGSLINTSFFETANLLGTVKIKGYINIESSLGGISKVAITDAGMGIMALAEKKAAEPIEPLDNAILHALAGGAKTPEALQSQLNIRSGDLAYHINKLVAQSFMDYEVRSGKANLMLTEQGFNSTGGVKVQFAPSAQPASEPEAKKEEEKDEERGDIFHILRGLDKEEKKHEQHAKEQGSHAEGEEHGHAAPHKEHEHRHEAKKHEETPAAMSPEQMKKHEHTRRMFSKIRYYLAEYWMWILLIIAAILIFAGAIYSMLSKMG